MAGRRGVRCIARSGTCDLSSFTQVVQDELGAYGLEMTVKEKIKRNESPVKSAFIKGGTQIHQLKVASILPPAGKKGRTALHKEPRGRSSLVG